MKTIKLYLEIKTVEVATPVIEVPDDFDTNSLSALDELGHKLVDSIDHRVQLDWDCVDTDRMEVQLSIEKIEPDEIVVATFDGNKFDVR